MRRLLAIAWLTVSAAASSAEPTLIGQWISDREASAAFNERHVRLQAKTAAFLKDSMGRLVVTFGPDKVSYRLPNFTTMIEGKEFPVTGFSESHPYTVVASTPSSIAIRTLEPVSHEPVVVVYNFIAEDSMWIYVSTSGSHVREYFKRVEAQ
jgi:hypothetical protein